MKTILPFLRSRASRSIGAILWVVGFYAGCPGTAVAVSPEDFAARWFTNAQGVLPYRLFIPRNYTRAGQFPLVLFLHGTRGRGNDNVSQLLKSTGPLLYASETNQMNHPSFVLAPQLAAGAWSGVLLQVVGLINALPAEFSLDTNRLYITGTSLGGNGTWDCIGRNPGVFAAAVPMAGWASNPATASRLTQIAIWTFHAADDPTVRVAGSRVMISQIRAAGGNPIYTEYASGGHTIWTPAYNTPGLMDWVYAQKRGVPSIHEPLLRITSPAHEAVWKTGATNVNLSGTAGALGEPVAGVSWTNLANHVNGAAAGTGLWSVTGIPLDASATNVVSVVATTTSWAPELGGVTTFNDTLTVAGYPP